MLFPSRSWPGSFRAPVWAIEWIHMPPVAWRLPATHYPTTITGRALQSLLSLQSIGPPYHMCKAGRVTQPCPPKNSSPHKLGEQKVIWDRVPPTSWAVVSLVPIPHLSSQTLCPSSCLRQTHTNDTIPSPRHQAEHIGHLNEGGVPLCSRNFPPNRKQGQATERVSWGTEEPRGKGAGLGSLVSCHCLLQPSLSGTLPLPALP